MKRVLRSVSKKVDRWLFKEEYAQMEEAMAEQQANPQARPQGQSGVQVVEYDPNAPIEQLIGKLRQAGLNEEEIKNLLQSLDEKIEHIKAQVEAVTSEDHSVAPTEDDIARYFQYHQTFMANMSEIQKRTGMWMTEERTLYEEDQFKAAAAEGGWDFLRTSCGLPLGDFSKEPWKQEGHGNGWSS